MTKLVKSPSDCASASNVHVEILPSRQRNQRLAFLSEHLGAIKSDSAVLAAYWAEALRIAIAAQGDGCERRALLAHLLYARDTCEALLHGTPGERDDLRDRESLIRRFVKLREIRESHDGNYYATRTRQIRFADDLYLIAGTIPLASLEEVGLTSVKHSGYARYSRTPCDAALTLSPDQWLNLPPINETWMLAFTEHYYPKMTRPEVGSYDSPGLEIYLLEEGTTGKWATSEFSSHAGLVLARQRLAHTFEYFLASCETKPRRIERSVKISRDEAMRYLCGLHMQIGHPNKVKMMLDGNTVRYRFALLPTHHTEALKHITHEEQIDGTSWRSASSLMLPVITYIVQSAQSEVHLKSA